MLKVTERNTAMMARVEAVVAKYKLANESIAPLLEDIKSAVIKANEDADTFSGRKWVSWVVGGHEHTMSWTLKQGSIMEVVVQRLQPGLVRVGSEERFFA